MTFNIEICGKKEIDFICERTQPLSIGCSKSNVGCLIYFFLSLLLSVKMDISHF